MWLMKILVMEYLDVYCVGFLKKVPLLSFLRRNVKRLQTLHHLFYFQYILALDQNQLFG